MYAATTDIIAIILSPFISQNLILFDPPFFTWPRYLPSVGGLCVKFYSWFLVLFFVLLQLLHALIFSLCLGFNSGLWALRFTKTRKAFSLPLELYFVPRASKWDTLCSPEPKGTLKKFSFSLSLIPRVQTQT